MKLYAAVCLAMGADLVTFALIVPVVGIGAESNALMLNAYLGFGIAAVALLKVAATVVLLLLLSRIHRPDLRRIAGVLGVSIGLVGAVGNVAAFVR